MKSLRDTQRDAKIDTYENYVTAANSTYTSSSGSYYKHYQSQLKLENSSLKQENKAYNKETQKLDNDYSKARKNSGKAVKKAYKSSSGKYKKALKSAYKSIKKKQAVSNSDLKTIMSNSYTVYAYLLAYNETLNNAETARLEQATVYATNSAEMYENTAEKYNKYDEVSQNKIDLNEMRASNSNVAKTANKYLDTAAKQYDTILDNDRDEINTYNKQLTKNQNTILKKNGTTNKLSKQSKSTQKDVQKVVNKCKKHAENGTAISATELAKLEKYYTKGYVTGAFYAACIDYNNALENKREAEAQLEIDKETAEMEKREYGQQEFENVQNEYENKTRANQSKTANIEAQQSYQTTRGIYMNEQNYRDLITQSQQDVQIYSDEIKALQDQINHNISEGYWETSDQEYLDALNEIESIETEIVNCKTDQEEWNNAIINLPFEAIDRLLDGLTAIGDWYKAHANLIQAMSKDLTQGDYVDQIKNLEDQIEQYEAKREEAAKDMAKALEDPDNVYGGKTYEEWQNECIQYDTQVLELQADIEDLVDQLRDDVFWRDFERAHDAANRLLTVLKDISDLITDDMYINANGQITEYGIAQLSNLAKELENAQTEIDNYSNDIANLNKLYEEGLYEPLEYAEKLNELEDSLLNAAQAAETYTDSILDMLQQASRAELDNLEEIIDKRKEALEAKKSYVIMAPLL